MCDFFLESSNIRCSFPIAFMVFSADRIAGGLHSHGEHGSHGQPSPSGRKDSSSGSPDHHGHSHSGNGSHGHSHHDSSSNGSGSSSNGGLILTSGGASNINASRSNNSGGGSVAVPYVSESAAKSKAALAGLIVHAMVDGMALAAGEFYPIYLILLMRDRI